MTTSFARHKASDELFASITELSDRFMETFMGKYGRPKQASASKLSLKCCTDKSMVEYLKACIAFLEGDFVKPLNSNDTDLINIRDEILGKIKQTLYLFTLH
jgi:hypothetical protein